MILAHLLSITILHWLRSSVQCLAPALTFSDSSSFTMDDDDDKDVDVSTFFKQKASDLASVGDLSSTLKRFGLTCDDRIDRRDLVQIYGSVKEEMEKEIFNLANSNRYEGAKEMRCKLIKIRSEFDSLQTNAVKLNQKDQCNYFEKARKELSLELKTSHRSQIDAMNVKCASMEAEQRRTNEIECENLELEISRMSHPCVKYSKRVIELGKAEIGLIKLKQFDDARNVRRYN